MQTDYLYPVREYTVWGKKNQWAVIFSVRDQVKHAGLSELRLTLDFHNLQSAYESIQLFPLRLTFIQDHYSVQCRCLMGMQSQLFSFLPTDNCWIFYFSPQKGLVTTTNINIRNIAHFPLDNSISHSHFVAHLIGLGIGLVRLGH